MSAIVLRRLPGREKTVVNRTLGQASPPGPSLPPDEENPPRVLKKAARPPGEPGEKENGSTPPPAQAPPQPDPDRLPPTPHPIPQPPPIEESSQPEVVKPEAVAPVEKPRPQEGHAYPLRRIAPVTTSAPSPPPPQTPAPVLSNPPKEVRVGPTFQLPDEALPLPGGEGSEARYLPAVKIWPPADIATHLQVRS